MGVDYGQKRTGIAISDKLQIISMPFCTFKNVSIEKDAIKILKVATDRNVSIIVLGLPLNMNGTISIMAKIIYNLIKQIIYFEPTMQIVTIDERLTTLQAEKMLIREMNISRKKRKFIRDKIAATFILKVYLDSQSTS
jgi:putative Holliday junction resolvase